MQFLLSLLLGALDRARGWPKLRPIKFVTKVVMGVCLYIIWILPDLGFLYFGTPFQILLYFMEPQAWLFVLAMVVGSSIGWGNAIGPFLIGRRPSQYKFEYGPNDPGPERWQVGVFKTNGWAALAGVGLVWGSMFPLLTWNPAFLVFIPIYIIAIILACTVSREVYRKRITYGQAKEDTRNWALQEALRGLFVGLLVILWQVL